MGITAVILPLDGEEPVQDTVKIQEQEDFPAWHAGLGRLDGCVHACKYARLHLAASIPAPARAGADLFMFAMLHCPT